MTRWLLASALLIGCTPVPTPDRSPLDRPDLATSADAGSSCAPLGIIDATDQLPETDVEGGVIANRLWYVPTPNGFGAQTYGSASQVVGFIADLSSGANANYQTCTHCLLLYLQCAGGNSIHCQSNPFFQRSGKASIDSLYNANTGVLFTGVFVDVDLEEVTIDPKTDKSTPVPGGACYHVDRLTFGRSIGGPGVPGMLTSNSGNSTGDCGTSCPSGCKSFTDCNGGFCINGACKSNIACPGGTGTYCGGSVGYDPQTLLSCTTQASGGNWVIETECGGACDTTGSNTAQCHLRVPTP